MSAGPNLLEALNCNFDHWPLMLSVSWRRNLNHSPLWPSGNVLAFNFARRSRWTRSISRLSISTILCTPILTARQTHLLTAPVVLTSNWSICLDSTPMVQKPRMLIEIDRLRLWEANFARKQVYNPQGMTRDTGYPFWKFCFPPPWSHTTS